MTKKKAKGKSQLHKRRPGAILVAIVLFVPVVAWYLLDPDCFTMKMEKTPLGPVEYKICKKSESIPAFNGLVDGTYANLREGYYLHVPHPDKWDIFEARRTNEGPVFSIPAGLFSSKGPIQTQPIFILTDDGSALFLSKDQTEGGKPSLAIYSIPGGPGTLDETLVTEIQRAQRTGVNLLTIMADLLDSPAGSGGAGPLLEMVGQPQISPDRRDAIFTWNARVKSRQFKVLSRLVVGDKYTYYVSVFHDESPSVKGISDDLVTMLKSFRAISKN